MLMLQKFKAFAWARISEKTEITTKSYLTEKLATLEKNTKKNPTTITEPQRHNSDNELLSADGD